MACDSFCCVQRFPRDRGLWFLFFSLKADILLDSGDIALGNRIGKSFFNAIHHVKPEATGKNWNYAK